MPEESGPAPSSSQPSRGGRGRGRGRGNNRGGNRGGQKRGGSQGGRGGGQGQQPADAPTLKTGDGRVAAQLTQRPAADDGADDASEADVCFICANPASHYSIAPCNHTTCHICGLRMRALYKTKDCAHCRTAAPFVIFTDDAEKRFEEYTDANITTTDSNIGIKYTNEDIVGDTVLLLRYNCPDASCDFAGLGWPDLHRHVKSAHKKRMCDLCTRNKKVFTHEHELFGEKELEKHMRRGDDKPGAADQTGFKGHPLCGFCGERFYDDDRLYEHCRMKHERCFICDRRDSRHPHYYMDYNALEKHFKKDHYLCADRECMEKKFVVFESELDLQAHQLSEHAGKVVGRESRVVDMSGFDLRESYQNQRRGGASGGGSGREARGGRGRGRGRDPNEDTVPPAYQAPLRRDEIAYQRQMAIHSAQSVSNRTFGGSLSASSAPATAASNTPRSGSGANTPRGAITPTPNSSNAATNVRQSLENLSVSDTANMSPEERARLTRHNSVIERAANLLGNDTHKLALFRQHISAYRQGSFTAPQLIDALFTLFADVSSNLLGTLTREVADLFENKAKADALRTAWQDWRAINEDYPSLPGLSGMHGATSSSSGWANAATANPAVPHAAPSQKHSNRVLKLKNSTRLAGPAPVSSNVPPGWTVASSSSSRSRPPAASSFPSLAAATNSAPPKKQSSNPSWVAASSQAAATRAAGRAGQDAFPSLPAAPKPQTTIFGYGSGRAVRRDYGHAESNFQWGAAAAENENAEQEEENAKGKKGKKKKVLVQWG